MWDKKSKKLKRLNDEEAVDYAIKNDEYIEFADPLQADWFSKKYKSVWENP